tara:strand:+ start:1529 stop:1687 length:159 start_codon:yes stop_codon:yes gene_type:complete
VITGTRVPTATNFFYRRGIIARDDADDRTRSFAAPPWRGDIMAPFLPRPAFE